MSNKTESSFISLDYAIEAAYKVIDESFPAIRDNDQSWEMKKALMWAIIAMAETSEKQTKQLGHISAVLKNIEGILSR